MSPRRGLTMNRFRILALCALVVLTACRDINVTNIVETDGGSQSDTTAKAPVIYGVVVYPSSVTGRVGGCEGQTRNLSATVLGSDPRVIWSSSNENVVSVDSTGTVTFKSPGTANVRATAVADTTKYFVIVVTLIACPVPPDTTTRVEKVTVSPASYTLFIGQGCVVPAVYQFTSQVLPTTVNQAVTWASSNLGVVTVSSNGLATAVSVGTTQLQARSVVDTTKTATVALTVSDQACMVIVGVRTIELVPLGGSANVGITMQTSAFCLVNGLPVACSPWWYSSNPSAILVEPTTGLVRYLAQGSATICVQWSKTEVTPKACGQFTATKP